MLKHPGFLEPCLENHAAAAALLVLERQEGCAGRGLEDVVHALAAETRALEIPSGVDLPRSHLAVVRRHEPEGLFPHLLDRDGILAEILLQTDEDDRDAVAESICLLNPLQYIY
jgi:hypothetical protein